MSGTFYPLLRPNLSIAALTVAVWGPERETVWRAPYYRGHWHLRLPSFAGNRMALEGLTYEILEPLTAYRVTYDDPGVYSADLMVTGSAPGFVPMAAPARGHWDQPTRVQGTLTFGDRNIAVDCYGMRDRSWGLRLDDASSRATYLYGLSGECNFLLMTQLSMEPPHTLGFLDRDGQRGAITKATIDAPRDDNHRMTRVAVDAEDEHGRRLQTRGRPRNNIAKQASPGFFAWMSMIEWDIESGGERLVGQFQDVWTPDKLALANRPWNERAQL